MAKKTKHRYELKEKLGEGGMGAVWRAYDTVLKADVALKMLLDITDAAALRLFYEECNKQAALVHPNIIEVRDVGSFDEDGTRQPYLVMPLLRGKTLADLIRESRRPLSTERCIDIFSQVCRGLHAAHDHGLLHRDIKPSNIFILHDDSVKIIDFGVAHRLDVSHTMGRKGTLLYMSPEQVTMKPLSRSSDVFSLAVVCYEALTGRQPFLASSEEAIAEAIRHLNPPAPSSLNPEVGGSLSQVLCKAMAKQAAHRFASAREFGDYLRRAYYDESFTVFDPTQFVPRLQKAEEAYGRRDLEFAQEMVNELESEGYLSTELTDLAAAVKAAAQKKEIDQLLDSARARVQDGEYRLALQRVHEALQLDTRHQEALALRHDIEARRFEADVMEWLKVGRQHLEKFSFSHARQAAQRILETNPGEDRALQFLTQVERKESEFQRIREQKRQVYAAALDAEQRNDITSALSKLKQVLELERQAPETQEPGRSAAFQSLYNKLHAEHEAIAGSYSEAKQALERGDYASAARLCDQFLEKYPQHTLFKALKFDNDQRWRRAISTRIIQVEEDADREPDLDRRVSMLESVVRDNPEVAEFGRLLQATQEKRDLVNGIANRARNLAEREQYGEALVQWETLQTIYPVFPGLSFEIDNVRQRRQFADRMARKNQWITQINRALEEADFDDALRLLLLAKDDFPRDVELLEIEKHIRQQREAASWAEELIRTGRLCVDQGNFAEGLHRLRQAHEIGPKGTPAKAELVEGLLRATRASQNDPKQARALLQEILNLDPGNHAAGGMLRFLNDQTEHQQVDEWISQARQLRTNNDFTGAVQMLEEALRHYPQNIRLKQVLREIDTSRSEVRTHDLEVVRRKRLEADHLNDAPSIYQHVDSVERIAERYKNDEEFQQESRLLRARLQTMQGETGESGADYTPPPYQPEQIGGSSWHSNQKKWLMWTAGGAVLVLTLFAGVLLLLKSRSNSDSGSATRPTAPVPAAVPKMGTIVLRSTPPNALILSDGKALGNANPELRVQLPLGTNRLEARLDGYEPKVEQVQLTAGSQSEMTFALVPAKQQIRIQGLGSISVDESSPEPIQNGQFSTLLDAGEHKIRWIGQSGYQVSFRLNVQDGQPAMLAEPLRMNRNLAALIVSAANQRARIYANPAAIAKIDGEARGFADTRGLDTAFDTNSHVISLGNGADARIKTIETGPGRVFIAVFDTDLSQGSLLVQTDEDGATIGLLAGNRTVREGVTTAGKAELLNLPAGSYLLHVSKDGFESPADLPVAVKKGRETTISVQLKKNVEFVAMRLHTLPGAEISIDGNSVGTTGADGLLTAPKVVTGTHRVEAHRRGKSATVEVLLSGSDTGTHTTEIKLDKAPGTVWLTLSPTNSVVSVSRADGESVPISGNHFELPEGKYHFVARATGYEDHTEIVDVPAEHSTSVNITLAASKIPANVSLAPALDGWDKSVWTVDDQSKALVHKSAGFGLFAAQPSHGVYNFTASLERAHLLGKSKLEWVADYRDPRNYLLFSVDRDGFEAFTVSDGKRESHSKKASVPKVQKYSFLVQIHPGRIVTSVQDGKVWKVLDEWNNLPQDVGSGKFGFKGQATIYSFSFANNNK